MPRGARARLGRRGRPATRVMQRWSIGHSRSRHGAHSAPRAPAERDPQTGAVSRQSVEPKTATSGVPRAAARCIGPESLVSSSRSSAQDADEIGERRLAAQHARGPPSMRRRSPRRAAARPREPTIATRVPVRRATTAAAAAKRSGIQRLAVPKAAPGLMPIQGPPRRGAARPLSAQLSGQASEASGGPVDGETQALEHRPIVVHLAPAPDARGHAARAREQRSARRRSRSPSARARPRARPTSALANELGSSNARSWRPRRTRGVGRDAAAVRTASTSATAR